MDHGKFQKLCLEIAKHSSEMTPEQRLYIVSLFWKYCKECGNTKKAYTKDDNFCRCSD